MYSSMRSRCVDESVSRYRPLERRDDPLERDHVRPPPSHPVAVLHVDLVAVGAVQEPVLLLRRELPPRNVGRDLVAVGDRLDHRLVEARAADRPRHERAVIDRERRVGHEQVGIDLLLRAEAGAARACAVRRVEREDPRLQLGQRDAVLGAGEVLRVGACSRLYRAVDDDEPFRELRRGLDRCVSRVRRSSFITSRSTTTSIVCLNFLSSVGGSSSGCCSPSTLTRENPSLRSSSNRSRNSPFRSRTTGALTVKRVRPAARGSARRSSRSTARDRPPADRAVRAPDARVQQAQVVVDLGHGADCRARVPRGRLLVDRDRGAESRRSSRRPASPSSAGTGARMRTATRRSGAAPRRRSCRRRGSTSRSPRAR